MSHVNKIKRSFQKNRNVYIVLGTISALIAVVFVGIGIFQLKYANRIYPNVYFHSIALGGKTQSEAEALIKKVGDERLSADIKYLLSDGRSVVLGSVGDYASYNAALTAQNAYSVGRNGSFWQQVMTRINLLRYISHIAPVYAYDRQEFEERFNEAINSYEKPVINSSLDLVGTNLTLTPSQAGVVADRDVAISEFERYLALQTNSATFDIAVKPKEPEITQENAQEALQKAQAALTRQLILSSPELPGSSWTLTKEQLVPLMDLKKNGEKIEPVLVDYKVASWSAQIAQLVNRDPVDAKFQFDGERVGEFEPAQPGLELDTLALTQRISERAFDTSKPAEIEIPLKVTQPALSTANVNNYGIKELVATGKSKFVGSPAGRIHNIQLASSKLNGTLIAPGETFSMYKVVGEVEKSTGYQDAFVILNGRTVPGVGGGLCQVSTTLFRAVLNAGLPVKERHQHAYRVYYYEQDSSPGIDAAVYFPVWDFKFENDTGNHLLLQTKVDTKKMTAEFNLYGVKDGRTVSMTKPVVSNQSPPPPELRVDDPTLPRGQEKEVDHAVWGANTSFTRTVTKDGQEYINDTFKSAYKPWQRVVMVGVKDN